MKRIRKNIIILILFILICGVFSETKAFSNEEVKKEKYINSKSTTLQKNDKIKDNYKKGEVVITYKQSFWNSAINLSANSIFNNYTIEDTSNFENTKIEKDKTVSVASNKSQSSTFVVSLIKSDTYSTEELIDIFKDKDWVISVEPNYIMRTTSITNDPYSQYQWALDNQEKNSETKDLDINPISTSSDKEKVIAIIDTGVDYTHEDLQNVMWTNPYPKSELEGTYGYDFINDDDDPMDDNVHGTHVAGIIAAEANNNVGITGTVLGAENIKIMALKVGDANGDMDSYSIIEAYNYIYRAQELGTNVIAINNSWGGYVALNNENHENYINILLNAINLVGERGALSICAAGNDAKELDENGNIYDDEESGFSKCIPSGLPSEYIVSVGASTFNDELAYFSNYGKSVDILAPGTQILSSVFDGNGDNELTHSRFIPGIYTEEKKQDTCDIYYDFENCSISDIPFTTNIGTLSIVNDKSYGNGEKCLKWEFDAEESDNAFLYLNNTSINKNEVTYVSAMVSTSSSTVWEVNMGTNWKKSVIYFDNGYEVDWKYKDFGEYINNTDDGHWELLGNYNKIDEGEDIDTLALACMQCLVGHYVIYLDDFGMTTKEDSVIPYDFLDGTSMATPFVTGTIGTLSNLYEDDTALQLKSRLLSCTRQSENLTDKVATGGILDLSDAITHTTSITLDKSSAQITIGENIQLTPTVTPQNATNKNVIWTSSNEDVATVENGNVTGVSEGETVVTVRTEDGDFEAQCEITVIPKLEINLEKYSEITKNENKYIENIIPNTIIKTLKNAILTNGTIQIYKNNSEIIDTNSKISTGMKIKISLNNQSNEFTTIVKGDVNGDGEADLKDILKINKHRLKKSLLTSEYLLAGDVNKDNEVNLKDILRINKFRLKKIDSL